MVKEFSSKVLMRVGVQKPSQRLFLQRWTELFHPQTMDSYAVKVLNARGALAELVSVLQGILQHEIAGWHLEHVWEETREKVLADIALQKFGPQLRKRIVEALTKPPSASNRPELMRNLEEISFLLDQMAEKYLNWLTEGLADAIADDDLDEVDAIAGSLASELATRRHPHSLYDLGFMLKDGFDQNWGKFLEIVHKPRQTFLVFLPIMADSALLDKFSQQLEFTLLPTRELAGRGHDLEYVRKTVGSTLPNTFALIQVEAEDLRTAGVIASDRLQSSANAIHLFYDESKMSLPLHWALVEIDQPGGRPHLKKVLIRERSRSFEREGQMKNVLWVLAESDASPETKRRVQTVVDYCAYAKKTRTLSSRFLHNWVALETLFGYAQDGFKLTELYLPALLNLEYIFRLVRNFIDDCSRCGVRLDAIPGMKTAVTRQVVHRMLDVLTNSAETSRLFDLTRDEDLLAFRARQLHGHLAKGTKVARLLTSHHKRLQWHLYRLYRIRNDLVHFGRQTPLTAACLPHLEDYVGRALARLTHLMRKHNLRDIRRAAVLGYHSYHMSVEQVNSDTPYDPDILLG